MCPVYCLLLSVLLTIWLSNQRVDDDDDDLITRNRQDAYTTTSHFQNDTSKFTPTSVDTKLSKLFLMIRVTVRPIACRCGYKSLILTRQAMYV
jgi:hypothetical protein